MKRTRLNCLTLAVLLGGAGVANAAFNDGGGPGGGNGGGNILCALTCNLIYGTCEIGTDIPIKDPYCEQSKNRCLAICGKILGGGGGGVLIGMQDSNDRSHWQMSPAAHADCSART